MWVQPPFGVSLPPSLTPFSASASLPCPHADAIASNLTTFATATNNVALGEAASIIAQACSNVAVPRPPISFDPISACVNTAMLTLNATTFGAAA